ncbi:choice-of-anchor C family protein [Streptantibioticus rubrisoli]|uniref:Choice-of-anchor C family protein n=1 Tax=Streptantibioticus rubrisoli TaxID=1387313 RepID=A0ABT1PIU5_9ACTN|nr:choice-of-anchor C family protein [Streptantibioticus rubrisoli]MCQ4045291.1 choice-of-anchor C family protein [Streptantibioticus rubrisoli]
MLASRTYFTAVTAAVLLAGTTGTALAAPAHGARRVSHLAAAPSAAPGFSDGSFENPRVAPNTLRTFTTGRSIGPWKVTQATVDLLDGHWQAADGQQSVDLNGTEKDLPSTRPGAVSQTFATTPGATYTVTYALAGNYERGPAVKTGKVLVDGQDFQDFSFDTTGKSATNMGWVKRQMTFVATGDSTTLTFASTTAHTPSGPVLDDVTVHRCKPSCCCCV